MNYRRLAVQRLDNNTWKELVCFKLVGFQIAPLREDERPSAVLSLFPIHGEPAQIKSGVEAHDERLSLNRHSEDLIDKFRAGVEAQAVGTVVCGIRFRTFRVVAKQSEFLSVQAFVVVEDSLFHAYISVIPQFTKAPESKCQ